MTRRRVYHPRPPLRWHPLWVRWHSGLGRWEAEVRHLGCETFLGYYPSVVDAVVAVNVWLRDAHGGLWAAWRSRPGRRGRGAVAPERGLDEALLDLFGAAGDTAPPAAPDDPWTLMEDKPASAPAPPEESLP